jgi:hypothetical protein
MRRRTLLTLVTIGALLVLVASAVFGVRFWRSNGEHAPEAGQTPDGLVPLRSNQTGATILLSGVLTKESFKLGSVQVVGSRLAGKSSDPDQFRAAVLDPNGRTIDTVKMWSPLLRFVWNKRGHDEAWTFKKRKVHLAIPASRKAQFVILRWPGGKAIGRIRVDHQVRAFCAAAPDNPSC